ncbi:MAG: hypothetical protein ACXVEF_37835 [Polyangiales bacterium]
MRNSNKLACWLIAGVVAVGAGGLIGCAGEEQTATRPEVADLKDGLTVLTAKPEWGITAAYKEAGRAIYIETRVGAPKPEAYRQAFPDEPANEMDMRVVDSDGRSFIIIKGGDTFVDPTWEADIVKNRKPSKAHLAHRDADFSLAEKAAGELVKAHGAPDFAPHVYHFTQLNAYLPARNPMLMERVQELNTKLRPEVTLTKTDVTQGYNANNNYNWWYGDLYSKSLYIIANHSATAARNYGWNDATGTSVLDEQIINCNHGTCAGSMSYRASNNTGWIAGYRDLGSSGYSGEAITVNTGVWGSCRTGYNWNTPPGHDCNDDSAYQLWQIRNQSPGGGAWDTTGNGSSFQWRGDANGHWFACDCSQTGKCNDWSVPSVP